MLNKNIVTILIVFCLGLTPLSLDSSVVISQDGGWSDNFNDGNIDGWTVQGWNMTNDPPTVLPGNFTADDFTLRAYDKETNHAYHNSTVAYGTWVFDVHSVPTPNNHSYIAFVSGPAVTIGGVDWETTVPYEYGLAVVNGMLGQLHNTFVFYRRSQGGSTLDILGTYDVGVMTGWHHIEITRDFEGNFEIYINDTLGITAADTNYATSEIFSFYTLPGLALDNIAVTPLPPETTTPTVPTTTPSTTPTGGEPINMTLLLIAGGGIAVVVIVALVVTSRR